MKRMRGDWMKKLAVLLLAAALLLPAAALPEGNAAGGIPAAEETFLCQLSQLIITSLVLWYLSENELITKTYMSNIAILFLIFSSAVGQAAQIVVGHLVGAGDFDEAKNRASGLSVWLPSSPDPPCCFPWFSGSPLSLALPPIRK